MDFSSKICCCYCCCFSFVDIVIGYERSVYFVDEPPAAILPFRSVALIKENNRRTEQTFVIDVAVGLAVNRTAASPLDFTVLSQGSLDFQSSSQVLMLLILIRADAVFEGDEAFLLTSSPAQNSIPYSLPNSGITFRSTTVVIRDFQSKLNPCV